MAYPNDSKPQSDLSALRRQAEIRIKEVVTELSPLTESETAKLVHELRVHQIELEMQNDELHRTQLELTKTRDEYADLYDNAPVGYLTLNEKGIILKANHAIANMLGVDRAPLLNRPFSQFVSAASQDNYYFFINRLLDGRYCQTLELELKKNGDATFFAQLESIAVKGSVNDSLEFRIIVADISKRKQVEEQIRGTLQEKEVLLKEIHHRVKNNLQVVSSLLDLQIGSIKNKQANELLREAQGRVQAMSVVHETLHTSGSLSEIDLPTYLSILTSSIFQIYSGKPDKIGLKCEVEKIPISIDQASPLGLIISELISNSLKYAFPDDRKGEITVCIEKMSNELVLTVSDDGVGMPEDIDWRSLDSLGLKLVRTLAENQLGGSAELGNGNGTQFTITFNIKDSS